MSSVKSEKKTNVSFKEKWQAYGFFLAMMWRANPLLALGRTVLIVFQALFQPAEVYVFSLLVTAITTSRADRIPTLLVVVIVLHGFSVVVQYLATSRISDWFVRSSYLYTQSAIFAQLAKFAPERLLKNDIRRDLDFVRDDLWRLQNLVWNTEGLFRSVFKMVAVAGLALVTPWWVVVLVVVGALLEAVVYGQESHQEIWNATWNSLDGRRVEYARYLFLSGEEFCEIRMLDAAKHFLRSLKESTERIIARFRSVAGTSAVRRFELSLYSAAAYGAVIGVIGQRAVHDPAMLSVMYVAVNLFGLMGDAFSTVSSSLAHLRTDLNVLAPIHRLFLLPGEDATGRRIPRDQLTITFDHVSFRYPGVKADALHDVTLTIRENEHVAIVGENGAGKSTFLRLLSGLDRPTSGTIFVNGIPLEKYRKDEWRRAFHLMVQQARLFQDFIRENLLYGAPAAGWKNVGLPLEKSLKIAGADGVVHALPQGIQTFIGDWAAPPDVVPHQVSGGEKQRLLIARTLIHGGRIVGFDEPTSAMDAIAETAFFERLHVAMNGRGLIFISHRFSTVRRASRILVFHEGRLAEDGSHADLLQNRSHYEKLYAEQAKWYA